MSAAAAQIPALAIPVTAAECYVTLWASTGEPAKYAVRRAMVRLLMRALHSEGIELCVEVA